MLKDKGLKVIPLERQRLLFNNQILQPDNSPIYWIAGIGRDCQIHLVENNPSENNYRSIAQVDENQWAYGNGAQPLDDRERELRQLSHERFNNCR